MKPEAYATGMRGAIEAHVAPRTRWRRLPMLPEVGQRGLRHPGLGAAICARPDTHQTEAYVARPAALSHGEETQVFKRPDVDAVEHNRPNSVELAVPRVPVACAACPGIWAIMHLSRAECDGAVLGVALTSCIRHRPFENESCTCIAIRS